MSPILEELAATLEIRKSSDPGASYVASLYHKGLDGILKKVGEETAETIIAAKNGDPSALVYEMADLWFHCCVLLAQQNLAPKDVEQELARRFGLSGLTEKASRQSGTP